MAIAPRPRPDEHLLVTARTLALDLQTARISGSFTEHGIGNILLKGPSIAKWLYSDGAARPYLDGDLLVPPDRVEEAEEILRGLDYVHQPLDDLPHDRPWHAHFWATPSHGIDLHRTLIGVQVSPEKVWSILSKRTEIMSIGGAPLEVLDVSARLMHVALHAAQNGPRATKSMQDLDRAVQQTGLQQWRDASAVASWLEALGAFIAGLRLHQQGRDILRQLGIDVPLTTEAALRSSGSPPLSLGFEWLSRSAGAGTKLRFLRTKLFPPRDFMKAWSMLARKGTLGLLLSYAWRVVWLAANAPRGFIAWLRARKNE